MDRFPPYPEISVLEAVAAYGPRNTLDFRYFFDDDYETADTFEDLVIPAGICGGRRGQTRLDSLITSNRTAVDEISVTVL